ncbi:MAG TPA: ligase-associated DNA damage response endonuclease PdeM [Burkholderiaceae bacterium]|nr:ligase-associated DNA damage response endonuclease PdeM [Burkholderiaceae bacterium]
MLHVEVGGASLVLLPERAAYMPVQQALLVADVHVGKAASFRGLGVPVPGGTTDGTLARLTAALAASGATRLIVLGDFVHSTRSYVRATLDALARWREAHAGLRVTLLRGNHDARAGDPPGHFGFEIVDAPLRCGPLWLVHEPAPQPDAYVLAGHVHPGVVVGARGFDRLRLPCFHFGTHVGVLPAFGEFTGSHVMPREDGDRVFAIAAGRVHEV